MEEDIERLRMILGEQDVWQGPNEDPPEPEVDREVNFYSSPDEDEVFLSGEHQKGGRLEDTIGYNPVHDFPRHHMEIGQEAPEGELFCTLKAVIQYPYNYICAASRNGVVREFFANSRIYDRAWDLFYIYPPSSVSHQALILVPSAQVQHLLATINESRKTSLKLPDSAMETGLVVYFPMDGTPRPRYLGHTDGKKTAELLKQAIPSAMYKPDSEHDVRPEPTEQSLKDFIKKMELMAEGEKRKKAAQKVKKRTERFARQRAWNHIVKRVQRYLGLREPRQELVEVDGTVGWSMGRTDLNLMKQDLRIQTIGKELGVTEGLDVNKPVSFIQEGSVVFICIDVEAWEHSHSTITEIGIATLDTADIAGMPPGKNGINWTKAIRARHFRIKEYEHHKNSDYVKGCPEHFDFGESEWVTTQDAPHEISKCFKPPYSAPAPASDSSDSGNSTPDPKSARPIVLVGHDVTADINFLKKLGYNPLNLSNLHEIVDTALMYRSFQREASSRNLGTILVNLEIAGWHLHNAGNDAVYTLQAMLGVAVKSIVEKKQEFESRKLEGEARIAECVKMAVDAATELQEGWSSDDSDGGAAVPPLPPVELLPEAKEKEDHGPWKDAAADGEMSKGAGKKGARLQKW